MSFDKGFNFRGTSGYVTDGANETYVLGDAYPVTRNGVTFGWTTPPTGASDRNSALDRRLAGVNYALATITFQIDLPSAANYLLGIAMGMADVSHGAQTIVIKDNATGVLTVGSHATTAGSFWDATNTEYLAANWPGSQTTVQKTFASSTMNLVGQSDSSDFWVIAHLDLSQLAGQAGFINLNHSQFVKVGDGESMTDKII